MEQKDLNGKPANPECPICGRVDIVALTSEVSRASEQGTMLPDPPQRMWRCVSCNHEWPRSPLKTAP